MASSTAPIQHASNPRTPCAGTRVLVVEDDPSINEVVCGALGSEGYACTPAFSGTEARLLLGSDPAFDLLVCDLMLPGLTGRDLIAGLRAGAWPSHTPVNAPVLVISARTNVCDRVDLLRCGADDYLVKPFDLDELIARAEVQLRHRATAPAEGPDKTRAACSDSADARQAADADGRRTVRFGSWELCEEDHTFAAAGRPIHLTRTEFDLMSALMRRPRKVFTRRELFQSVWDEGTAFDMDEKTVSTHVANVRAKLRPTGTDAYIETVWGIGFKLSLPDASL